MEMIIPVAILFGIGFGSGFGVRMLMARKAEQQAAITPVSGQSAAIMPPAFKPRSSLRAFDLREDPLWGR